MQKFHWIALCAVLALGTACGTMSSNDSATGGATSTTDTSAGMDSSAGDAAGGWSAAEDTTTWGGTDSAADTNAGWTTAKDTTGMEDSAAVDASADMGAGVPSEADQTAQVWKQLVEAASFAQVSIGGQSKLELVDVRVTVQIEGLRARTLVDHIYRNPTSQVAQGTFRYSLPPDSSVSYYAMFAGQPKVTPQFFGPGDPLLGKDDESVATTSPEDTAQFADQSQWGTLQEAKIAGQVQATQAYEGEIAKKIDPALGEVVGPNTFEAKVYPIAANGYNRVLIAYEQTLPRVKGKLRYTYAVPKTDQTKKTNQLNHFEFTAVAKKDGNGAVTWTGNLQGVTAKDSKTASMAKVALDGPLAGGVLAWDLATAATEVDALTGTDPTTGHSYSHIRLQPLLAELATGDNYSPRAVFLLDTSRSEHQRFASSMKLLEGILAQSPKIQEFQIITFDVGARWLGAAWLPNTPEGRQAAKDALDGVVLEGATDFGAALRALTKPPMPLPADKGLDVFVLSDGSLNWGDVGLSSLLGRYTAETPWQARFFSYRIGVGSENSALYQALAQASGAVFNCEGGDPVLACATAHHSAGLHIASVQVVGDGPDGAQLADLVVAGRQATLFAGGSLQLAARVNKFGPAKVVVSGTAPGIGAKTLEFPVDLQPKGQLAARAWAEIAVALLVDAHDPKLEKLTLALSQHFRVASAAASFLVLESEAAYAKYNIVDESNALANADLSALLGLADKIAAQAWTTWNRLDAVLKNYKATSKLADLDGGQLYAQLQALAPASELQLPDSTTPIPLVKASEVSAKYLALTKQAQVDAFDPLPWFQEADARRTAGKTGAAIRALSTPVENRSGDPEYARLIGCQLKAWDEGALAAGTLLNVLEKRPFEPQSYRDLAGAVGLSRPVVTTILFEAALAGTWDGKFKSLKTVIGEEYALFAASVLAGGAKPGLANFLNQRMAKLNLQAPTGKLRVTLTWNVDATDIDLWVTDPVGEKCYYSHKTTKSGGQLLDDLTGGYGPERFEAKQAIPGKYLIEAHYFGSTSVQQNPLIFINATIQTHLGQPDQTTQGATAVLRYQGQVAKLGEVWFK
ncbi:MAG: hypothetical protein HY902_19790 [Deltaproteobacteria bacterium]|nr:hypothetical protein [Deltaproteobacteria bacterium]